MNTISETKQFYTTSELLALGFSHYKMKQLESQKIIRKINRTTYENLTYKGEENDFYYAWAYVPFGVICLMSAAKYYGLTEFLPDSIDVAVDRKKKVSTLPDWPSIHLYYFNSEKMENGCQTITVGENQFRIFDVEKTVADIIYYRNKVGIEETTEVLKNYLSRSDRDIDKLYDYAKTFHCENILRTYLEVLL